MNYLYFILIVLALFTIGIGFYLYKYAMESPYRIDAVDAKLDETARDELVANDADTACKT